MGVDAQTQGLIAGVCRQGSPEGKVTCAEAVQVCVRVSLCMCARACVWTGGAVPISLNISPSVDERGNTTHAPLAHTIRHHTRDRAHPAHTCSEL